MPNIPDLKLNKRSDSQMIPFKKCCPKQACLVSNYAREKLGGKLLMHVLNISLNVFLDTLRFVRREEHNSSAEESQKC